MKVLHLDDDLVAIDKPCGLLVHPSALDAHESQCALHQMQAQLGQPLWPVHRLDKGTSGVLLFARHREAARHWGQLFESGQVHKRYLALVRGWPAQEGLTDYALARDPELPSTGQPRLEAATRYRCLARFEWPFQVDPRHTGSRYALMQIEPLTGRRHQIRRHFKHLGHPLIGDTTHGKGDHNRAVAAWLGVRRLWLHAWQLRIDGNPALIIESPPGPQWEALGDRGPWTGRP